MDVIIEYAKMAVPLLAIGGAWGGAKVALNGTKDRVKKLEKRADDNDERVVEIGKSLVRIETKQDILLTHMENKQ